MMQPQYMKGTPNLLTGALLNLQKSRCQRVVSSLMNSVKAAGSLVGKVTAGKGPSWANATVATCRT